MKIACTYFQCAAGAFQYLKVWFILYIVAFLSDSLLFTCWEMCIHSMFFDDEFSFKRKGGFEAFVSRFATRTSSSCTGNSETDV